MRAFKKEQFVQRLFKRGMQQQVKNNWKHIYIHIKHYTYVYIKCMYVWTIETQREKMISFSALLNDVVAVVTFCACSIILHWSSLSPFSPISPHLAYMHAIGKELLWARMYPIGDGRFALIGWGGGRGWSGGRRTREREKEEYSDQEQQKKSQNWELRRWQEEKEELANERENRREEGE